MVDYVIEWIEEHEISDTLNTLSNATSAYMREKTKDFAIEPEAKDYLKEQKIDLMRQVWQITQTMAFISALYQQYVNIKYIEL